MFKQRIEAWFHRVERDENELQVKLITAFGITSIAGVAIFFQLYIAPAIRNG